VALYSPLEELSPKNSLNAESVAFVTLIYCFPKLKSLVPSHLGE
jgi:hypothetical protein